MDTGTLWSGTTSLRHWEVFVDAPNQKPGICDERVKMAYEAALKRLDDQTGTFSNLRNRTAGLLSTAALATTFATSVGLFPLESGKVNQRLPAWTPWALLGIFTLIGIATLTVLWPVKWVYGPSANKIIERYELGQSEQDLRQYVVRECKIAGDRNLAKLNLRANLFRGAIILLLIEIGVLIFAVTR
ncbi:hypothetical protein ACFYVM_13825 [Streptomyces sp. NPDC003280]|uniref:hypothetical protein n=1 Tax=Streptomyces sp. NPDC003280 TaxID=3364680 RepID=UPI003678D681